MRSGRSSRGNIPRPLPDGCLAVPDTQYACANGTLTAILWIRAAHCSVVHNSTDRRALLDFKEAITEDPTGVLRSWNDSIHHCMWSGVYCSRRHPGRVTVLDLHDTSLAGQITPSLGNLTSLRKLTLDSNRLSRQLPPLNRLTRLEELSQNYSFHRTSLLGKYLIIWINVII